MQMKAVLCKSLDGPEALEVADIEVPKPDKGEVLVRISACALNFMDTLVTRGKYQYKPELPFSPSGEICGTVEALGKGAERLKQGERVMGYIGWGGAREFAVVPEDRLVPVPDGVSDAVAAGLSITYGTALHGLRDRAQLAAGETLAVLGASGGAGLAAVEIGRLLGAHVIAVASSDEKLAVCRDNGAEFTLNYKTTDLRTGLKDLTGGKGVDVVYDCVGGDHAEAAVRATAWNGRFLVVGFASGDIPKLPLNLLLLKGCAALGVFWGRSVDEDASRYRENMALLMNWVHQGQLTPRIDKTLPLTDVHEGLRMLTNRSATGKIVLVPAQG
ncbi:MAG: NADPH:quinone oxidoreductase family protein [Pseudomonadota bacterium]